LHIFKVVFVKGYKWQFYYKGVKIHAAIIDETFYKEIDKRTKFSNGEIFYNLKEAKVLIENWRQEYNTVRPHSSLGYRPPAPEAIQSLIFEPFWFTSNRKNMLQILT
jgi:transposase InsO family protein